MEDNYSFNIDFQNITDIPMPETFESESSQEIEYYVEITRSGKKAYQCADPTCGKIYKFKSEVNRHVIIHQNDRPYCCTFTGCTKTFKRPETLEDHIRLHEGSLPFSCDEPECDRRFASKAALRYHRLIHKNNREFKCEIQGCEKTFLTMHQLKQHQKASGLHCHKAVSDVSEEKPHKIHKKESKAIPSQPVIKQVESIQWEMKSQKHIENSLEESYEMILDIISENRRLKKKLSEYEANLSPKKECQFNFQYTDPVSFLDVVAEPSSFFDNHELKLLDFLKERGEKSDF